MKRRAFFSRIGAILATICMVPYLAGCNAITDLEHWIPVALSAVSSIVKLLGPIVPAPVSAIIVLIQAGFSALLAAIQSYQSGKGVLADITNAIESIEGNFQAFFAQLNVSPSLLALIEGLASLILSTIQAFSNEISPASANRLMAHVGNTGRIMTITPVKRSISQFKAVWNAECVKADKPEAQI